MTIPARNERLTQQNGVADQLQFQRFKKLKGLPLHRSLTLSPFLDGSHSGSC